jgi:hypothetical protein
MLNLRNGGFLLGLLAGMALTALLGIFVLMLIQTAGPAASVTPTVTPTAEPTSTPTPVTLTDTPTTEPTSTTTQTATIEPTSTPTQTPTIEPTSTPTQTLTPAAPTVTQTVPSVTTTLVGGSGGSPYALACPPGSAATGIQGRAGSNVDQVQVRCDSIVGATLSGASSTTTTSAGGGGGSPYDLGCPAGYVVVGIRGRVGNGGAGVIDMLSVDCAELAGSGTQTTASVGSTFDGSIEYSLRCPEGTIARGLQGSAGNLVNAIGLQCQ